LRVHSEHPTNEVFGSSGGSWVGTRESKNDSVEVSLAVVFAEGELAEKEREEDDTKTPALGLATDVGLSKEDFGRQVFERAVVRCDDVLTRGLSAEAKVDELGLPSSRNHDVFELEVTVDEALLVDGLDGLDDLLEEVSGVVLFDGLKVGGSQVVIQVLAFDELEKEESVLALGPVVDHLGDSGVFEDLAGVDFVLDEVLLVGSVVELLDDHSSESGVLLVSDEDDLVLLTLLQDAFDLKVRVTHLLERLISSEVEKLVQRGSRFEDIEREGHFDDEDDDKYGIYSCVML